MSPPSDQHMERWIDMKTFGRIHRLVVETVGDRTIVHGCTSTYNSRQLALAAAKEICEPNELELDIRVSMGTPKQRDEEDELVANAG